MSKVVEELTRQYLETAKDFFFTQKHCETSTRFDDQNSLRRLFDQKEEAHAALLMAVREEAETAYLGSSVKSS